MPDGLTFELYFLMIFFLFSVGRENREVLAKFQENLSVDDEKFS